MTETGLEIAIIGMAGRFPGAGDTGRFWRNLRDGIESITRFTDAELAGAGVPERVLADPDYVRAQGVLPDADRFDAEFFGISPREADLMDPQQRVLLECAWETLEDAGYDPDRVGGPVGVYAGTYYNSYLPLLPPTDDDGERFARAIANEKDYVATRLAHRLDLTGPALTVQTACSTSLVAVHLACQALLSGECDLALAGGATARAAQVTGYLFRPGGIFSSDGHCRAFDDRAEGTVPGNGVGMVALKRLADALADGDQVHAVIRGSAIGNDGGDRAGFTAPGVAGQARVIAAAYAAAGVDPATVAYVEAHGSATRLGDPIEVEALTRVFGAAGAAPGGCALGSVKTNIGHTHAAAGVAGLIKTVLALRHGLIPPSLHHERPNAEIDFAAGPFRVVREPRDWPDRDGPRRAGVSSFGMGGTGAHVVLEEAPPAPPPGPPGVRLLRLSARTEQALEEQTGRLAAHLAADPGADLSAVAHTLARGRRALPHRRTVVAADPAEAAEALAARDQRAVRTGGPASSRPSVAFLIPGVGDQRRGLGHGLYRTQPVFRAVVDECVDLLEPLLGRDLRELLYPASGEAAPNRTDLRAMLGRRAAEPADPLHRTRYAQPAAFVTGYALARLWAAHGIRPDALIGYSLGEYVAACLAGVFTLPDALRLVARRAELIDELPPGALLAVPMAEQDVAEYLPPDVRVAAVNGPNLCVVGGPAADVAEVGRRLADARVAFRRLPATQAFHTPMMAPVVDDFTELVGTVPCRPPEVPYVSNVTGTWVTAEQATDPAFWGAHLLRPVRFADGLAALDPSADRLLVELGPGQSLGSLAAQVSPTAEPAVPSLPGAFDTDPEERHFPSAVGRLWLLGAEPDVPVPEGWTPRRVSLPTYPFQRRRHWAAVSGQPAPAPAPALVRKTDVADFFQVPSWRTLPPQPVGRPSGGEHWLLFVDDAGVGEELAAALADTAASVTTMTRADAGDHAELLTTLRRDGRRPDRIVHLWTVGLGPDADEPDGLDRGFGSLLALGRALGGEPADEPVELTVVTDDLHVVAGTEAGSPLSATVLGVCRVLPLEHPHLRCRSVDVSLSSATPAQAAHRLMAELSEREATAVVALRGRRRFTTGFESVRLEPAGDVPPGRNYLITGGLGGVGLAIARELARVEGAGLALVSRTGLPPRDRWDDQDGETATRVQAVRELERLGARVVVLAADVTEPGHLRRAGELAVAELGPVHAVVHAAGVAGGGLVRFRDPADAARVLAPKVRGGLAVTAMAGHIGADAVVLCSSTLALTGAVGQADYAAANAFLDALAQHAAAKDGKPQVISVDWDAWQDVGMAQRHLAGEAPPVPDHPLLRARLERAEAQAVYDASVSGATAWLVDEHRMLGDPVVPGTGHLELARAAFADLTGADQVELTDFRFATPVVLDRNGERPLRVVFDLSAEPAWVTVVGPRPADGESRWQVHATGRIAPRDDPPPPDRPIDELTGGMRDLGLPEHTDLMSFGGRSRCLRRVWQGDREALAELVLPDPYLDDLDRLHLHPSLLDLAAGFVGTRLAETFRIPISYGRLRLYRPLTRRIFSHHCYTEDDRPENETRTADITLYDEDGRVLAQIDDFVLKRVADLRRTLDDARAGTGPDAAFLEYTPRTTAVPGPLAGHLATGLKPAEGADALRRLLAAGIGPQVAVVAKDLDAVAADIAASALTPGAERAVRRSAPHPRPRIGTPYRPPADPLQEKLAALWQDLLGIDRIGVDDMFFELGGHSLLGLEMVNRIGRDLGLTVPLGALFEARTVAQLADLLHREAAPSAEFETREE